MQIQRRQRPHEGLIIVARLAQSALAYIVVYSLNKALPGCLRQCTSQIESVGASAGLFRDRNRPPPGGPRLSRPTSPGTTSSTRSRPTCFGPPCVCAHGRPGRCRRVPPLLRQSTEHKNESRYTNPDSNPTQITIDSSIEREKSVVLILGKARRSFIKRTQEVSHAGEEEEEGEGQGREQNDNELLSAAATKLFEQSHEVPRIFSKLLSHRNIQ